MPLFELQNLLLSHTAEVRRQETNESYFQEERLPDSITLFYFDCKAHRLNWLSSVSDVVH